jgi:type VI secretion system protein ImpF
MPLSLLERLIDPEAAQCQPNSPQYERKLKAAIRRDLTALLNVRRSEADVDPKYAHAADSLLNFGVIDFTALNLTSSVDQEQVRYSVERAIRHFEPRLSHVSVFLEEPNSSAPLVRFTVEATMSIGNRREEVVFPVALHRDSRRVSVPGEPS